jgi:hypothetical protein
MAKQVETLEVRIEAALNAAPTIQAYKDLRRLQQEVVAGSKDFDLVSKRMADIKDVTGGAKEQSMDLVDALGSAPGPIGSIARGYDKLTSSTNKWGLAWKATGIGLLVALVGQLVMAFTSNEKAMKKLEPIMIGFEQILGGIFAVLEPVFDLFIDLAMKAMPYLQKAIGGLYTAFAALYSFFKNFITTSIKLFNSFGKVLKGVFTLDWDTIKEGVSDATGAIKEGISNVVDDTKKTWNTFNDGLAQTTKTQKKNLKEQSDDQKKFLEEQKAIYADAEKARQANLDKAKAIALDGAKTEEERLAIEKKYALDTYNSKKKLLEDQAALYPKGSKEYEQFQAQLTSLDADYLTKKTEFRNKDTELAKKAFDEEVKSAQDANKRKIDDLTGTYNLLKEKYGENSKEARASQDEIFKAQEQGLANERALYEKKTELTKEEKARLADIIQAQKNLTTTIQIENEKRIKADIDALVKKNETEKAIRDKGFEDQLKANELNLQEQQRVLTAKKEADAKYYADQEILLAGNVEKLNELNQKKLADAAKLVEDERVLEQKRLATKLKVFDDIVAIAGAESAVGKAALVAKQLLLAKELFLEAKKTITFAAQAGARSTVAVAEGTAQTAKVGFPQNIPLLIGYAAQAVGIISAIVSAVKSAKASAGGGDTGGIDSAPAKDNNPSVPRPRGMASGGMVYGPGSGQSDLIPTMLSNGESVINAQSTSMFRPLLSSINQIGGGKGFANGGMAMNFNTATSLGSVADIMSQTSPIKTYVVASDMTNQQMLDRNIKERSTL